MAGHQRDLKREQTWRRHIERQRASGSTVRDYCFDHDLNESAFYFWRRVVAERDREAGRSDTPAFVPITLVEAPAARNDSPIDIHLGGGRRVRIRSGCDRDLLAAVLALLGGRSC
jgi:transposase-like protein